jgi:phosphoribosylaminoimidazole (AIR) synthetase
MTSTKTAKSSVYDPAKPFNQQVRELIVSTHPREGPVRVIPFGKRFIVETDARLCRFSKLPATDGIGTKGLPHWKMDTLENGVQDAFAMVVNDLIESGHKPVWLQDHIQMQEEDPAKILRVVGKLVALCKENA